MGALRQEGGLQVLLTPFAFCRSRNTPITVRMRLLRERYRPPPKVQQAADRVLRRLEGDGAKTSREFAIGEKVPGWWDGGEKRTKAEKAALDSKTRAPFEKPLPRPLRKQARP